MEISPGARIDRYLLVEPLGEGGQGSVWKALDALDANRTVALKLVSIAQTKPTHLERVRREARALAKLEHPSLVRCHGLFEDFKASVLGLVLELVDGKSLADALDDARFTPALRWAVLQHVAQALAHLHERHIVHRDLKPENIVLAAQFWTTPSDPNTVKIIDFGIAAEEGNPNPLTAYGNVIGTPAYMAPELIDATYFAGGRPTPAIDVFAFGVVAWILLLGGHPTGLSAESTLVDYAMEYRKVVSGQRTWLGDAPPFVVQCLEPRPERRLQSGNDLVAVLRGSPSTQQEMPTRAVGPQRGTLEAAPSPELFHRRAPDLPATIDAPMPLPHGQHAAPRGPVPMPPSRRDRLPLVIAALLGVIASCIGLVLLVTVLGGGEQEPANTSPGQVVAPPETARARATVEPPSPQLPMSATSTLAEHDPELPKACSVGDDLCACCPSGRTCGPGGCGAALKPGEQFDLRLWTVHRKPGVATAAADGVCVARATDPATRVCGKVGETYGGALPAALPISTRDLTETGLVIQITAGDRMVERGDARHGLISRSALCDGLTFGGFEDGEPNLRVTFYLDERGPPPRRACILDRRGGVLSRKDRDATLTPREWSSKCFAHVNSGYFAWAKTACEKARAEPDPSLPESSLQYNLGLVERGFGNRAAAREYFSKSLELRPHAEVQAALNALDAH